MKTVLIILLFVVIAVMIVVLGARFVVWCFVHFDELDEKDETIPKK